MSQSYIKDLAEPWFTLIKLGIKISEGRVRKGIWKDIRRGDKITFTNNLYGENRSFTVTVVDVTYYPIFYTYLEKEGLPQCLPGIDSINQGVAVYRQYYTVEQEQKNGVIGIRF
jgi:ASC-1-like (ASCH) protein